MLSEGWEICLGKAEGTKIFLRWLHPERPMRQVVGWKEGENVMKTINQEKVEKEEGLET